jgi:hypothetical protein
VLTVVTREELSKFSMATSAMYGTVLNSNLTPKPRLLHADSSGRDSGDNWFQTWYNFDCHTEANQKEFARHLNEILLELRVNDIISIQTDNFSDSFDVPSSGWEVQVYMTASIEREE